LNLSEISAVSDAAHGLGDGFMVMKSADAPDKAVAEVLVEAYPGIEHWPEWMIEEKLAEIRDNPEELRKALHGDLDDLENTYDSRPPYDYAPEVVRT
jgi:hypothetical protein